MNVRASVGIHGLDADSIAYGVYVGERSVSIALGDGTQLHWDSLDALDGFVARLGELAAEARSKVAETPAAVESQAVPEPARRSLCKARYEVGPEDWSYFLCTLDAGHDGDHVAHGSLGDEAYATWPQTTAVGS